MAGDLYLRVALGLPKSDGAVILKRHLAVDRAWSYALSMWDWFAEKHPEGEITGPHAAYLIAEGSGWTGDADKFCSAMVTAQYLSPISEGYRVRGWAEWAGYHLTVRAKEAAKKRGQRTDPEGCSPPRPGDVPGMSRGQVAEKAASKGDCPGDASLVCDLSVSEGGVGGVPEVQHSDSPVAATLPCSGSAKSYGVTRAQIASWRAAYPGVDVPAEIDKARVWLEANPTRRKTHGGMARFLVSWMNRAQDDPRPARRQTANGRPDPAAMDYSKPPEF